ncbi:MAG TPA: SpoIIE family protein phosphatase [Geobacteraceae bacterium]|nr:SpoIIE family protein phosphatase [Geobacteraceae bacterium]
MKGRLRVLHLEDDRIDAELVEANLAAAGIDCAISLVSTGADFKAALERGEFDMVLADLALPAFNGMTALAIVRGKYPELPFIFVSGKLGEEAAIESLKSGATDYVLKHHLSRLAPAVTRAMNEAEERAELRQTEEALRQSELRSYQLQVELACAAEVQAKLLPRSYPQITGFDIAARCLPAKQVGGDFFDWLEVCPGVWSFTLGDVMGKGMAAAMLMATVRAALRSVAHNRPEEALRLTEQAVLPDLENSESFVTLFHSQLYGEARRLTFVDCGHGYAFLRRAEGTVEELLPRGLPLGVPVTKSYQEGTVEFAPGDTLIIYSDGLIDARPELGLTSLVLAGRLSDATNAEEMMNRLIGMTEQQGPQPDDITVLVVRCDG